ncbi:FAD-dependent pyridine nucleotide-disulphide oxidoreductase [Candidatus Competibacter denitrificans Run_A_D11]|uniref:NADH:ubiquinone reductase (non-electrogenic) n=1 Tax=Candidatus Competibacter denitrificans Run_A_D11 TaxID=1400863 RepID=W6MBE6_9GAMM|nr:NAD(P)/FAD-dependent oxidoreductase [Candidatus Competibacter denitrificans]CDI03450.1 FAD-dependent pyridine nucleotide-disulphide oxidoreductase [Candidatus Competibacter denitrificans Run_A_D11]HAS85675.1 NAD(P)/FAD-dependent oxidoreductase [Candidatus Competibacteraceae bacterium]HRC69618.1 NAD(P)/FAD-dependent oxidoreductase [Candidatus Competibacter denitrificans]
MLTATVAAVRHRRANVIAAFLKRVDETLRVAEATFYPFLDLLIRLWLAQVFWVSGVLKLANWDNALTLATYEYPVSWLNPVTAAIVGVTLEVVGSMLLAFGLATRLAALALLLLTLVIQFEYLALDQHLYWAALFGWYVIMGAGSISLDRLLASGLAASALPLVKPLARLYAALTRTLGPVYQLALRLWLASLWFTPVLVGRSLLEAVLGFVSPLLALGLATRLAAISAALALLGAGVMGADEVQTLNRLYQCFLLGLIALRGPGPIAADARLKRQLARWFPPLESWADAALADVPHVVIVGAGFGGLKAAHGLRLAACRVSVIDKRNYHLFQPLLYQVATASLSPADVATPIRSLFRDQHNVRVLLGEVADVETTIRQVILRDGSRINYDYLVLATGARHSYFGCDDWEPYAPGLKQIDDATAIRRRLLLAFEQAENCADPEERQRLLTFVIVGGGPTGVELAGAIIELARHGLSGEFRNIDPAQARVLLVQSAPRLLPAFAEALSAVSAQSLRTLGVEVLLKSRVEKIDAEGVLVSGQRIGARTIFWAAGVMASPAAQWLKVEADAAGRLKVGPDLAVPGLPNVFAIGDTALSEAWDGQPVPGLAPAAKQQGAYVAKLIKARLEGRSGWPPFRYGHLGNLATIGRQAAVVEFGGLRLSGALAWWLWGIAHVFFLVDTRKRLSVAIEWFWAYLTYKRGTRLITGGRE